MSISITLEIETADHDNPCPIRVNLSPVDPPEGPADVLSSLRTFMIHLLCDSANEALLSSDVHQDRRLEHRDR